MAITRGGGKGARGKGAGRPRLPAGLHKLKGYPSHGKNYKKEAEEGAHFAKPKGMVPAPKTLNEVGRAEWNRMVPQLIEQGLLDNAALAAFEVYCMAYSSWVHAADKMKEDGPVMIGAKGFPIQSPWWKIQLESSGVMRQFMIEFGMTPASATRVKSKQPDKPKESDLDNLMPGLRRVK